MFDKMLIQSINNKIAIIKIMLKVKITDSLFCEMLTKQPVVH